MLVPGINYLVFTKVWDSDQQNIDLQSFSNKISSLITISESPTKDDNLTITDSNWDLMHKEFEYLLANLDKESMFYAKVQEKECALQYYSIYKNRDPESCKVSDQNYLNSSNFNSATHAFNYGLLCLVSDVDPTAVSKCLEKYLDNNNDDDIEGDLKSNITNLIKLCNGENHQLTSGYFF